MHRAILVASAMLAAGALCLGGAPAQIYNEQANARGLIRAGIREASRSGKNVVLVFGANW